MLLIRLFLLKDLGRCSTRRLKTSHLPFVIYFKGLPSFCHNHTWSCRPYNLTVNIDIFGHNHTWSCRPYNLTVNIDIFGHNHTWSCRPYNLTVNIDIFGPCVVRTNQHSPIRAWSTGQPAGQLRRTNQHSPIRAWSIGQPAGQLRRTNQHSLIRAWSIGQPAGQLRRASVARVLRSAVRVWLQWTSAPAGISKTAPSKTSASWVWQA